MSPRSKFLSQRRSWGLAGSGSGRNPGRAWEVSARLEKAEDGPLVDGVDLGWLGKVGAFVDAVQSLVRHAEAGGGRDSLTGEQVADVRRPRSLRLDREPHLGGGLLVLSQAEGRPRGDLRDVSGCGGGQLRVELGDRLADQCLGIVRVEGRGCVRRRSDRTDPG